MRSFYLALLFSLVVGCASDEDTGSSGQSNTDENTEPAESDSLELTSDDSDGSGTSDGEVAADASAGEETKLFVIDVRTQEEWDAGHIEQAVHIPHTEIADRIGEVTEQKDAQILVYCARGGRAGTAKKALEDLGYTSVENGGGLDDVKERFGSE